MTMSLGQPTSDGLQHLLKEKVLRNDYSSMNELLRKRLRVIVSNLVL